MKTKSFCVLISLIFIVFILAGKTFSSGKVAQDEIVRINNILIDKITKEIRIKAKLAITEGILEYLLVGDEGKTYESVFKVAGNKPSDLNFALLLIGCEPLDFNSFMELRDSDLGYAELVKGHKKSLLVAEIYENGKKVEPGILMRNREGTNKSFLWVYTGGFFMDDNRYAGDIVLSHVGIWPDQSAVINLFSSSGNPYRGNFGLEMNTSNSNLKIDQEFEIVIRRHDS